LQALARDLSTKGNFFKTLIETRKELVLSLQESQEMEEQFICVLRNRRDREIQDEQDRRSEQRGKMSKRELQLARAELLDPFEAPFVADSGRGILKGQYLRLCGVPFTPHARVHPAFGEQAPRPLCCAKCTRERTAARASWRARSLAAQTAHNYSSRFVLAR